jgi:hypothetical protein
MFAQMWEGWEDEEIIFLLGQFLHSLGNLRAGERGNFGKMGLRL